jgi:putative heme iron utilization protein
LLAAEQNAIDHMNADHRDALNLYATKLLGAEAADWRCTGCDPDGLDISADKRSALRLDFSRRIVTPAELRHVLKDLAEQARAATP